MRDVLFNLVASDPRVAANPLAKHAVEVIQRGTDQQKQQRLQHMCNTLGMSQEDLAQEAGSFIKGRMVL